MARNKVTTRKTTSNKQVASTVKVDRGTNSSAEKQSLFERLQLDMNKNQSYLNLVLGGLVLIVLGTLLYNYFNRPGDNLGPAQQAENQEQSEQQEGTDVAKENLPGQYTVKEGDTLFGVAENYYGDGYQFTRIVEENKLANANAIEVGQVLTIPAAEAEAVAEASPSPATEEVAQNSPSPEPVAQTMPTESTDQGTGGAENQTVWGERITGNTYTVQEGDWLSKIAGRAYGDVMSYEKIAQANNIANPNLIEVGQVLTIPRN